MPYGTRDLAEVRWFTFEIINYLIGMNVKLIVIACNTATASALRATQRSFEVPIIGVIEPGARAAVEETRNRRVGVLATPLTAASGAYRRAVHSLDAGIEVHEQACPEFVPMIECGVVDGPGSKRSRGAISNPSWSVPSTWSCWGAPTTHSSQRRSTASWVLRCV